jgi:hypothetical protein
VPLGVLEVEFVESVHPFVGEASTIVVEVGAHILDECLEVEGALG